MNEDLPLPGDGAPVDLNHPTDHSRLWDKIDKLCDDMATVKTDIAVIKNTLETKKQNDSRKASLKQAFSVAGMSAGISLIVAYLRS